MKNTIQKWLGFEDQSTEYLLLLKKLTNHSKQLKELTVLVEGLKDSTQKFSEIECSQCKKVIVTYPYGGGYYREYDGAVLCSNTCVDARQKEQAK